MGRQTKTFRQTKKAGTADYSAKSYARINRMGNWKVFNVVKKGEKV